MAIAFDVNDGGAADTVSNPENVSNSITVASADDRLMLCVIVAENCSSIGTPAYNSSNFTTLFSGTTGTNRRYFVGYLIAPATGANNFTVSLSRDAGSRFQYSYSVYVYNGVDQSTPIESSTEDDLTFGDSTASATNTPGENNTLSWSCVFGTSDDMSSPTENLGTNNTRVDLNTANTDTRTSCGDFGVDSGTTSRTADINTGGAGNPSTGAAVIALKEAAVSTFTPKVIMY